MQTTSNFNRALLAKSQSLIALLIMVVGMSLLSDTFLTPENGLNILRQISVNLCLSIGMTMIILSGGIDLSVGAILALSGAVAAGVLKNGISIPSLGIHLEFALLGGVIAGIAIGLALGWFNGFVITRFRLPPFVATLGMFSIARGLTMLWTGGFPITGLGASFGYIGTGILLGVPMPVWITAGLVLVFVILTMKTRFGRHLYAVGGNERASRLTGLKVDNVKIWVYTLAGGLAAVGGLLVTARLDSAQPSAGLGY